MGITRGTSSIPSGESVPPGSPKDAKNGPHPVVSSTRSGDLPEHSFPSCSRFLFELARRHPSLPDAVLAKLYDSSEKLRGECCSSKDPSACLDSKVSGVGTLGAHPPQIPAEAFPSLLIPTFCPQRKRIEEELLPFLERANQLCGQYNKLPFLEFKKR